MLLIHAECIVLVLAPLLGALVSGLFGKTIGRSNAHRVAILGVAVSFFISLLLAKQLLIDKLLPMPLDLTWYIWGTVGELSMRLGFYLDQLSIIMLLVVTFVSLMVHIYTIGYMHEDDGYQRFFSYIAFFTFSMLMLVLANNFLQLFFGWEAVGVASYLLIGFWFKRPTAIFANLKAFLVNRVGDFGFLLGIAGVLMLFGSLDYAVVFNKVDSIAQQMPMFALWGQGELVFSAITVICILLFIGAMGKSAQVPLHVWLPDSMEGPTPISALIHAATMVTAGVFMVARMSPLFEHSEAALSFILLIGATTCFFMGLLGIVQNDIKRIIAYSTLSQLGYMMVALGASAYGVGVFHLVTHAFFKALLFLGAGSVIIALHHEQDIWKMGGLWKKLPITYITMLIGTLALVGAPLFSGFYSKDLIIEAVQHSNIYGAKIAYYAVLFSVFITALYSFRLLFVVFHTKSRVDSDVAHHVQESPWVVWLPLILLAIPSVLIGGYLAPSIISGEFFAKSIYIADSHSSMTAIQEHFHGIWEMAIHGIFSLPVGFAILGALTAWICYIRYPSLPQKIVEKTQVLNTVLQAKYGFDKFNQFFFAGGARFVGWLCWRVGDKLVIDGLAVNGSASAIGGLSRFVRHVQSGYVYHYVFAMIIGLVGLLIWLRF